MASAYIQDEIFGRDSDKLILAFLESMGLIEPGTKIGNVEEKWREFGKEYVEMGVRLGYIVYNRHPKNFTEIACGIGIPSLTLSKLGITNGEAFDFMPNWLSLGKRLRRNMNLRIEYVERDFYKWNPNLKPHTFLIADKPHGEKENYGMEMDVVKLAIKHNCHLGLVPYIDEHTTEQNYIGRCETYARELILNGYNVETVGLSETLFLRVILATYRGSS